MAICTAIATPRDVNNQDGVAMLLASAEREASAPASAAEASAGVGCSDLLSMMESIG